MNTHTDTFMLSRRTFCGAVAATCIAPEAWASDQAAAQMMSASYQVTRFANARFTANLSLKSKSGRTQNRALSGVGKMLGQSSQARLISFLSPSDMNGVGTLTVERGAATDDLWVYLPAMRRVRRLVASNRADPWVGSDFSFGDILGHKVQDWQHRVAGQERLSDGDAWIIESVPANASITRDTGYGRRRSWLRKSDLSLLRSDIFAPSGAPLKSALFGDFRVLDARSKKIQPMLMVMRHVQNGSTSTLRFGQFRIDQAVASNEVTPEALAR